MRWHSVLKRFRSLFSRNQTDRELQDELAAHIEFQTRKHLAEGMNEQEAYRRARIEFGSVEALKDECREIEGWRLLDALARNVRYAMRCLTKSPGFTSIAILILAIGVGSNLAVFSLVNALLLRPLPLERPEELVRISSVGKDGQLYGLPSTVLELLHKDAAFQGLCGFDTGYPALEVGGTIRSTGMLGMTADCFETLGIKVQLGRLITPDDDRTGTEGTAIITQALWQSAFAGRPDVLGKRIRMQGATFTVVGVAERQFEGLLLGFPAGIVIPLRQEPSRLPGGKTPTYYWVNILARRAPGVLDRQVLARIAAERTRLLEQSVPHRYNAGQRKDYFDTKLTVTSAKTGIDYFLRDRFGKPLYAIFGICASILLIGCVNLANVLLARSLARRREIAVRLALGARKIHIASAFVSEVLILVVVAAALGAMLARAIDQFAVAQGNKMFGNLDFSLAFDWRMTIFLLGAVWLVAGVLAGVSLWQANRLSSHEALKESGRGSVTGQSFSQKILLTAQVALTLALVTGSGLFSSSLSRLYAIDLGINTRNVWTTQLNPRPGAYNDFARPTYYRDIQEQLASLPNVASVTLCQYEPFFTFPYLEPVASVENAEPGREFQAQVITASDGFFRTLGARIVEGEDFRHAETTLGEPSVILSESLARRLGGPPRLLGHHVRVGNEPGYQRLKIIGIASDMQLSLANPNDRRPLIAYVNFWQHPDSEANPVVLIKTFGGTLDAAAVRRVVDSRRREYVDRFSTLDSTKGGALVEDRLLAYLSAAFSALALVMAATGLFGLLSYHVANRTGEIGIRMALGAQRRQIQWLVIRQVLALLAIGSCFGVALSLLLGKAIAGLLYGVNPHNPLLLALSLAMLGITAVIAAWLPAYRASSIDPLAALHHE
ncbi:MAG: ADOP family duplicated permease [Bryobacteraceae bacterium]